MDAMPGIGVSPGAVAGPVARFVLPTTPEPPPAGAVEDEKDAAGRALDTVAAELGARADQADGAAADILRAQAMIASDPALAAAVAQRCEEGVSAAAALTEGVAGFRELLAAAGPYLAERAADLDDIGRRAVAVVLGLPTPGLPDPGRPHVLVADDLSPADTVELSPGGVLAIVTARGGPTSHTAILARARGIPAVVACPGSAALADGDRVLVDGAAGTVTRSPSEDAVRAALTMAERRRRAADQLTGPGRTADGHPVDLLVNVGSLRDLAAAADADAAGVGLFRTEFLFLDRAAEPGVGEQVAAYREVFAAFSGRPVVVRTLDAGADKPLPFLAAGGEPNPALGVRGIRVDRLRPELLDRQLRAVAEAAASTDAEVRVMAPMVTVPAEVERFVSAVRSAGLGVAGCMVEVPAAALRAGELAGRCDFLSIGTNDLAQYLFAADRQLGDLADLLDPWQPALLDLVAAVAEAGAHAGVPVGVCGEAAADPLLAPVLTGLGVTSLSMAPASVPAVRLALVGRTLEECRSLATAARGTQDAASARAVATSP